MHKKLELPGIERIRARFLDMLEQRQRALAEHALAAWEGSTLQEINDNLAEARYHSAPDRGHGRFFGVRRSGHRGARQRACD